MDAERGRQSDPSRLAREMLDTGKRAVAGILAGGAWVAWGLSAAHAVKLSITVAVVLTGSFLLVCGGYCVLKGWSLPKKHPSPRRPLNKGFLLVIILEAVGVAGVVLAAQKMARLDALPDWIGVVIGLHFFGVARVFRAPVYYVTGIAITLWCLLSWVLFRGNALAVSAAIGIGAILWATSSFNLFRVLASRSGPL